MSINEVTSNNVHLDLGKVIQSRAFGEAVSNTNREDNTVWKTIKMSLNLLTHILIVMTVFVCLLYAWSSSKLKVFQLHIVLCVLGYTFFMTQGILVLSRYNSWSLYLERRYRKHLHWFLQLTGFILAAAGSGLIIHAKNINFNTNHGILGLCALVASTISVSNGCLPMFSNKLSTYCNMYILKHVHYISGIGTLVFSAICLCLGLNTEAFRSWAAINEFITLIVFTCLFTVVVSIDFATTTVRRVFG